MKTLLLLLLVSYVYAGCGKSIPKSYKSGQTVELSFSAGNGQPQRTYSVHVPANYNSSAPTPVVFSFHGHGSSPEKEEAISGLSGDNLRLAGSKFLAVYPQGLKGTDGKSSWMGAPYSDRKIDDVQFVTKMIRSLSDDLCVDASRIYATGKSNGGGFTNYLACTPGISEKFAAFSTVSAALYQPSAFGPGGKCSINRTVPLIDFHGTADHVIPYSGKNKNGEVLPNIDSFRSAWAKRNGCQGNGVTSGLPKSQDPTHKASLISWSQCNGNAEVQGWKLEGGQHAWPRTKLSPSCKQQGDNDCDVTVLFATDFILPFFSKFTAK